MVDSLDDERLADVFEELPDSDQQTLISHLDAERAADVLEAMSPDDAADLLGELPDSARDGLLALHGAGRVRAAAPAAELLLQHRRRADDPGAGHPARPTRRWRRRSPACATPTSAPALASMVFVCRPPTETPTGRYLGCVHIQRLLREAPFELVAGIVDDDLARLSPDATLAEITRYFATYNLVAGPVVDAEDHLLGAVTVDDVLDHLLPDDWREQLPEDDDPTGELDISEITAALEEGSQELSRMPESSRRRLDQPRSSRARCELDPDSFARFSERIARFLGTGRFLAIQTVLVLLWIALNVVLAVQDQWDPYPFILLNLAFSTQAAYAAPLILLAQNRQDDRDRVSLDEDRVRAERTKADTEYLARELAALRLAVGEMASRDYLRGELDKLADRLGAAERPRGGKVSRPGGG